MTISSESKTPAEFWLPGLCVLAALKPEAPLEEIKQAMDRLANRAAPIARNRWKWIIMVQAIGVAAPMTWLCRRVFHWTAVAPASLTFCSVLIFIGTLWWWRWKRTQQLWARARLVAEVARGRVEAAVCPTPLESPSLRMIPALQSLLSRPTPAGAQEWPAWRDVWIQRRLEDQLDFYTKGKAGAELQRKRLSRWITLFMDLMLALAVAGVILTGSSFAPIWLRAFGDVRLESAIGFAGALLPLGIILFQALRSLQELNRRTSRFARQISMLEQARSALQRASTPEAAMPIVQATESQLLDEVVDWYFEAETAEQYFKMRDTETGEGNESTPSLRSRALRAGRLVRMLGLGGLGLAFLMRVILGRALWVIASGTLTLCWLAFNAPADPSFRTGLTIDGSLLDQNGHAWYLSPDRKTAGCIIIAHGLWDGATLVSRGHQINWTQHMGQVLERRLGSGSPNIGLVDWARAAVPTDPLHLNPRINFEKALADISAIRPQAREIGDGLAFRLAQLLYEKQIDPDYPLHLIGHSAGGFVVARAAIDLNKMHLAPAKMRVTLLDTPAPDDELLVDLPKVCPVDYYITSKFVQGLRDDAPPAGIHVKHITPKEEVDLRAAHSEAHKWYIRTIEQAPPDHEGFNRSPILELFLSRP